MVKQGGAWIETDWQTAMDYVVRGLKGIRADTVLSPLVPLDRPTARSKNSSCCSPWFVVSVLATSISGCVSPISPPMAA
jgi:hypothetical protein